MYNGKVGHCCADQFSGKQLLKIAKCAPKPLKVTIGVDDYGAIDFYINATIEEKENWGCVQKIGRIFQTS